MTKCIKRIRDLSEYALYKFTLYLLCLLTYCLLFLLDGEMTHPDAFMEKANVSMAVI